LAARIRWPRPGRGASLYVILYACLLHYVWALLLALSPAAAHSTPVAVIVSALGGRWQAVAALLACAVLAQLAPLARRVLLPVFLVPQQLLLLMSAGAGLYAASAGHYADGVARGWPFILGDQAPVILVAFLYTTALLTYRAADER
jgi:hypothetical protein